MMTVRYDLLFNSTPETICLPYAQKFIMKELNKNFTVEYNPTKTLADIEVFKTDLDINKLENLLAVPKEQLVGIDTVSHVSTVPSDSSTTAACYADTSSTGEKFWAEDLGSFSFEPPVLQLQNTITFCDEVIQKDSFISGLVSDPAVTEVITQISTVL